MKRKAALVTVLLLAAGLTGCTVENIFSTEKSISMEVPDLLEPVDVKLDMAVAQKEDIYQLSIYSGEVVPYTEELHFTVDGYLESVNVIMGDMVQEGDVLAVLSEEQVAEQIENLEKEIDNLLTMGEFSDRQASLDLEIAREELQMMHEQGQFGYTGWAKELEIQKLELAQAEAQELRGLELQKKQETLRKLQEKIGKNEITAPFSGRIVYIADMKKGDGIQGYTPVIYIADDSRLSLSAEYISESSLNGADRICAKILDKEVDISLVPYDTNEMVKAALAGEEMQAQFSIDTQEPWILAGQYAVVMVYQSYKENVLTIPINALYRDGSGQYVYRQVDGARVRCDVKTDMTTDTKAEVIEGLEEGDMVYVQD
ncbi:MAG: biotin/lipoyl-binding protein [Lachnospiraceae bacterium]|uniref:efflux RND transporter periplasmic adaptor subunit n=1 Tax=Acetatifactor aquisgranensis TaxID=2941233 RepID=UPI0023B94CEB|nr:biotin/lipoyl-binding protein [Acetatifactor aquisgranensis]MCI8543569.1 biotin/lipoyl-binding protein [Lachnospiraceae bacterium]